MKTEKIILSAVCIFFIIAIFNQAQAQKAFTFKIPVDLKDIHGDVDKVKFIIELFDVDYNVNGKAAVQTAMTFIDIGPNRELVTTLAIGMDPKNPENIISYRCRLEFHNEVTNKWLRPNGTSTTPDWCRTGQGSSPTSYWCSIAGPVGGPVGAGSSSKSSQSSARDTLNSAKQLIDKTSDPTTKARTANPNKRK